MQRNFFSRDNHKKCWWLSRESSVAGFRVLINMRLYINFGKNFIIPKVNFLWIYETSFINNMRKSLGKFVVPIFSRRNTRNYYKNVLLSLKVCDAIWETIHKVVKCDFEKMWSKLIRSENINFWYSMEICRWHC